MSSSSTARDVAAGFGRRHNEGFPLHRVPAASAAQLPPRSTGPASMSSPAAIEFLASPSRAREPGTGDYSGDLKADVVAALGDLAEVINQRLKFGPFGGEQGFAMEGCGDGLVFGRHGPSLSVHGPRKSEPSARVLPPGQLRRKE